MLNFLLAASLLLPVAPQQPDTDYEVIRVIDGRLLVGEILEHDLDGLVVQSARNGGTYRLSWGDLFPGEAERLKTGFGYRTSFETPTVSADRLLLVNGQQITGRILRRDSAEIEIRSRGVTTLVPTVRLAAPPEKVVVDADQVLTPEQFYAERLPQVGETGMAQFDFAQELEAVAAYEQALVHLQLAQALAHVAALFAGLVPFAAGGATAYTAKCAAVDLFTASAWLCLAWTVIHTAAMVVAAAGLRSKKAAQRWMAPLAHTLGVAASCISLVDGGCLVAIALQLLIAAAVAAHALLVAARAAQSGARFV